MQTIDWPQPPIWIEDVPMIYELLTEGDLERLLKRVGWLQKGHATRFQSDWSRDGEGPAGLLLTKGEP